MNSRLQSHVLPLAVLFYVIGLAPGMAHQASNVTGGIASGFLHPLFGLDHVVAMVAVGLWGAILGPPAVWVLPIVFPLVMAVGGGLSISGISLPHVEIGIAVSALVLGLMIAFAAKPPNWVAAIIVGSFAIFHGHAHGTELPQAADPLAYSLGFVVATGLLHLFGIGLGLLSRWRSGILFIRSCGGVIAATGAAFLVW
ncbi:MAG: HupE/UreJ family protein [Hyphomicrobiaceae bacterium]